MTGQYPKGRGIFYGWWVVAAAAIGISASPQPFLLGSLGLFMKPFGEEFGWSRSEVSLCISLFTLAAAICFPLVGRLIDKYGAKKILLPSMFFLAVGIASISLFVSELIHLALVFLFIGTFAAGSNTVSYLPMVSAGLTGIAGLQ